MAIYCKRCERMILGNAGKEQYNPSTQTYQYTCRACLKLDERLIDASEAQECRRVGI